jgi:uncharacterized protein YjbI with pentapeptide repeats
VKLHDDDVLEGVKWTDVDLSGQVASDICVSGSHLTRVRLTGATLDRATFVDVVLEDCELSGATIEGATLERTTIKRSRMSTLVAPDLTATDVVVEDVKADGAWLRMATLLRCDFHDCDLSAADLYSSKVTDSRFLRCNLDGAELTSMKCERVAVHGSTFADVRGAAGLRGAMIGSDQILSLAPVLLAALDITVDDDFA